MYVQSFQNPGDSRIMFIVPFASLSRAEEAFQGSYTNTNGVIIILKDVSNRLLKTTG